MPLKDKVKAFLQMHPGYFTIGEFPVKEWGVTENNMGTRLPEYALDRPQWIVGRTRAGTSCKEWSYVVAEKSGQVVMELVLRA